MRVEQATAYETAYVVFDDAFEFASALPNWLLEGWTFSDARRDGDATLRVQFQRPRAMEVSNDGRSLKYATVPRT